MKSMKLFFSLIVAFVFSTMFSSNVMAGDYKFVGNKSCMACHKTEKGKMAYVTWAKTVHANAYKTLENDKSKEIAKKKGLKVAPNEAEECLKCHSVGYMKGEQRATVTKEEGVSCEGCHGPASAYKTKHGVGKTEEGIKNGLTRGTGDTKICTKCHNSESPTYKAFDYKKYWDFVKH